MGWEESPLLLVPSPPQPGEGHGAVTGRTMNWRHMDSRHGFASGEQDCPPRNSVISSIIFRVQ
jgi:hypothetical protein